MSNGVAYVLDDQEAFVLVNTEMVTLAPSKALIAGAVVVASPADGSPRAG
jgi:hypothetical protein